MGMMIHRAKTRHARMVVNQPDVAQETHKEIHEDEVPVTEKPQVEETVQEPKDEGVVYTKDDINTLPFFSLKSFATKQGIDVNGKKAAQLRAELIEKLGL